MLLTHSVWLELPVTLIPKLDKDNAIKDNSYQYSFKEKMQKALDKYIEYRYNNI
jgi:hypothetical protein